MTSLPDGATSHPHAAAVDEGLATFFGGAAAAQAQTQATQAPADTGMEEIQIAVHRVNSYDGDDAACSSGTHAVTSSSSAPPPDASSLPCGPSKPWIWPDPALTPAMVAAVQAQQSSHSRSHSIQVSPDLPPAPASSPGGWFSLSTWLDPSSDQHLYLFSFLLLFGWVTNNIGWVYITYDYGETYAFWCTQILAGLTLVMMAPVVLYRLFWSRTITPEMRSTLHWHVYAVMGLLDALYNILTTVASADTTGPVQNLIFQLPVPITMLCVKLVWPSTRFRIAQYIGAVIIVGGAVISVVPQLTDGGDNTWDALIVYIIGVIFYSFSSVYKSYALKHAPTMDYWYVSFVESAWAFVLQFGFMPMLWIPGVSNDTPSTAWPHFAAGAKCMFLGVSDIDPDAVCGDMIWITFLFTASNIFIAVVGLVVCRRADALLFNIVNSVQLPITNLLYTSTAIMTIYAAPFSYVMWIAVGCVTIGFIIYQFVPIGHASHQPPLPHDADDERTSKLLDDQEEASPITPAPGREREHQPAQTPESERKVPDDTESPIVTSTPQ